MDDLKYVSYPPSLQAILDRTEALGFKMASEPRTCALLRSLVAAKPNGQILELGTGTGVATAWLLSGMSPKAALTSVDTDPQAQAVARDLLGSDERVRFVLQDGAAFLRRQPPESFDLVFADAMPGKYEALEEALAVVKPGGFYIIDDMLPQPNWPEGHAEKVPRLLDRLGSDERFLICPMAWASGVVVAVRRIEASRDNRD
jgi:predicted O-methyltransferase YrrM